ncbi:uncharacterized protein M437DRAFT_68611 [Aureobasidium melanogenum CBS 110374]|uniref:Uncharacterized protein n=1 Tax=Aureobasidium melanogenum (strain CBS 110374) TaxID=1043003 RepID=A0A074VQP1_AURM1|nr:uncharacterized protein M437DRAFT_68611 [Aureobasidium melanogenum CBS 110374]KEQ59992.1 hypothetical protein M437DRAFT_68611 [Aureobasidium melanogenum CBS 110374]
MYIDAIGCLENRGYGRPRHLLKRTTLEDMVDSTTSSAGSSSKTKLEYAATSTDVSSSWMQPETYEVPSSTEPISSDLSTLNSDAIAPSNNPQTEAPGYSAASLVTEITAFSDVSTVNSDVASVQSIATQATEGLDRRAVSSVQSSQPQPQSSAT